MTPDLRPLALSLLFACAIHQTCAQDAATAAAAEPPQLLAKYTFENIPAYIPDWGAGHGSTYKPATGWKTPFTVKLDIIDPHSGVNAMCIRLLDTTGGEKIVHTPSIKIPSPPATDAPAETVAPGKLHIRLYARAEGVIENGVGIRVLERDEKGASLRLLENKKTLVPVAETATWQELAAEGTLHSRTRSVSLMLVINKEQTPATIWLDDISIEYQPVR
ncbi:MAG: hypothetical protein LBK99_15140 [Opitutaceae bacterium]|jgi:hypothetical protein|nr:hypothetical protein [Opitutaceae bacterium]